MRRRLALLLLLIPLAATTAETATPRELRVLFVGNSLLYTNRLPTLLGALAIAQPRPLRITTTSYVAPGGRVSERWQDGHAAAALRGSPWDVLVLQEQGGLLACLEGDAAQRDPDCQRSEQAHRQFAALAQSRGTRVLLLGTWTTDRNRQRTLDRATRRLATRLSATFVPTGKILRDYADERGNRAVFPDGMHPSLSASLIMAAQLYRAISGEQVTAADVAIDFPLLPPQAAVTPTVPLEQQHSLATDDPAMVIEADALAPLLQAARH